MLCHWAKTVKFNHSWHKFKNDISIFVKIKLLVYCIRTQKKMMYVFTKSLSLRLCPYMLCKDHSFTLMVIVQPWTVQ